MHTQSTPRACLLHDGKTRLLLSSQREGIRFNRTFFSASCTSTYASQARKALMKSGDAPTKLGFLTSLRSLGLVGWNFFSPKASVVDEWRWSVRFPIWEETQEGK